MGFFSGILKGVSKVATALDPVSGLLSAGLGFLGQERANDQNVALSRAQMQYQSDMSGTAHQREVKDLIAAGLNPMLSARYGGASTPSGSLAHVENSAESADKAWSAAATRKLINAQIVKEETQAQLNSASAAKASVEARAVASQAATSEHELERRVFLRDKYDAWHAEGKAVEAAWSESKLRQYLASMEWNSQVELNSMVKKYGYNSWQSAIEDTSMRQRLTDLILSQSRVPKARAEEDFYRTDFGKSIAPYMSSAESIARIGATGLGIGRRFGIGLGR